MRNERQKEKKARLKQVNKKIKNIEKQKITKI